MLLTMESKTAAHHKFEALMEKGRTTAGEVIQHVMTHQPTDHLARGAALRFVVAKQACAADSDYVVDTIHAPDSGKGLHFVGHMRSTPVTFFLEVEAAQGEGTIRMRLRLRNDGTETLHVRAVFPELRGLLREHHGKVMRAAVPQKAAGFAARIAEQTQGLVIGSRPTNGHLSGNFLLGGTVPIFVPILIQNGS